MRLAGHVAHMGEIQNAYKIVSGKCGLDLNIDGWILKWILKE
jgi:hypothetical protein